MRLDLGEARVVYSPAIRNGDGIQIVQGAEEVVRASLIHRLTHDLGYRPERLSIEQEYSAGRGANSVKPRIDLILDDGNGDAFFFVEIKDPSKYEADKKYIKGQLFGVAGLHEAEKGVRIPYLVYYTLEERGGELIDKAIIIDHNKYKTYDDWVAAGEMSLGDSLTANYNKPRRVAFTKGGTKDLVHNFSLSEIEAIASNLHDILWGGGATGDTEVFTSLVNLILAKVQDEYDTETGQEYKFQVLGYGDEPESPDSLFLRVNQLYRTALHKQLGKDGDLTDQWVINKEKFSLSKVLYTVGQLERYSFIDGKDSLTGRDILGEFFERIQRTGFKQTKGQFFTPPTIVRFMLYALELDSLAVQKLNTSQTLPYIIDPSCGSATFLIEAMRMVTNEVKRRRQRELRKNRTVDRRIEELFQPDNREHKWARQYIYGVEHNFDLATAAKVNMILHGDGASNIFHQDGLKPFRFYSSSTGAGDRLKNAAPSPRYQNLDENARFDVVVSNPPFSVELDADTKKFLGVSFIFGDKRNSENLFIERYWQLLADGGRMAVVLPESVFDTSENKYIRLFLYWYFDVVAVVSLPQLSFEPYTQTKTSILFAKKKTLASTDKWRASWSRILGEYGRLRTRALNYIQVFSKGKSRSVYPSIAGDDDAVVKMNILDFVQGKTSESTATEPVAAFVERYRLLIEEIAETDSSRDSLFGECNTAWVFARVAAAHDSSIFSAEASSVGYKRNKRGVTIKNNELFAVEVAPCSVDRGRIVAENEERIAAAELAVASLEARLERAMRSGTRAKRVVQASISAEAPSARPSAIMAEDLRTRLDRAKGVLAEAHRRGDIIQASINEFYDPAGNLMAAHADRLDPNLISLFHTAELSQMRSEEVIVKRLIPTTILERMRATGIW